MWPLVLAFLRSNAVRLTVPIAAVVGAIGYGIEGLISDKYTPYSSKLLVLLMKDRITISVSDETGFLSDQISTTVK